MVIVDDTNSFHEQEDENQYWDRQQEMRRKSQTKSTREVKMKGQ